MISFISIQGCVGWSPVGIGYRLDFADGTSREATASEILAATKAQRIEQINAEVRRRLIEHYGDALEQVSRSSGVYGETAQANHLAGVQATIAASNVAQAAVNAATSIEAVEAVSVSWPTLV